MNKWLWTILSQKMDQNDRTKHAPKSTSNNLPVKKGTNSTKDTTKIIFLGMCVGILALIWHQIRNNFT